MATGWQQWHLSYDDPGSDLSHRRRSVQACLETWLDARPGESLRVDGAHRLVADPRP